MLKKQITLCFFLLSVLLCLIITGITIFVGCRDSLFIVEGINSPLILIAILLFIFLTAFSFFNENCVFLILPFIFIAFPTIINNIFPGVLLSTPKDLGNAVYPITNHIEIFLILLLIKHYMVFGTIKLKLSFIFSLATFLFLFSSFIAMIIAPESQAVVVLGVSIYPVKLILLLQILLSNYHVENRHMSLIVRGLLMSIGFLLLESSFYSKLNAFDYLTSGSLGTNSFGNIIGQIVVFIIVYIYFYNSSINNKLLCFMAILIGLITVILTNTRMALLALVLNLFVFFIPQLSFNKILGISVIIAIVLLFSLQFVDTKKYDSSNITKNIKIDPNQIPSLDLKKIFVVERTYATSSIVTRLDLFQSSLNMFYDSPVWGIGYGNFNLQKYKYGFKERILIDSHNGYLFLLSQLGLIGLLWIYLIYFMPFFLYKKYNYNNPIFLLAIINTGMAICDCTNAGIFKNSILSLLLFNSIVLYYQTQVHGKRCF